MRVRRVRAFARRSGGSCSRSGPNENRFRRCSDTRARCCRTSSGWAPFAKTTAGSRRKCWSGRSRSTRTFPEPTTRRSNARAPLVGCFGNEPRSPFADFEDVVVAAHRVQRIDDLVVGGLRVDLHGNPVAFATDAFDLYHGLFSALWRQLACWTGDRNPPVRNRGPAVHARSTVAAILSG